MAKLMDSYCGGNGWSIFVNPRASTPFNFCYLGLEAWPLVEKRLVREDSPLLVIPRGRNHPPEKSSPTANFVLAGSTVPLQATSMVVRKRSSAESTGVGKLTRGSSYSHPNCSPSWYGSDLSGPTCRETSARHPGLGMAVFRGGMAQKAMSRAYIRVFEGRPLAQINRVSLQNSDHKTSYQCQSRIRSGETRGQQPKAREASSPVFQYLEKGHSETGSSQENNNHRDRLFEAHHRNCLPV